MKNGDMMTDGAALAVDLPVERKITHRKIHPKDNALMAAIYASAGLAVAILVGIIGYVLVKGVSVVNWSFLTSVTSQLKGTVGIAGNIVNTLYIIVMTMMIGLSLNFQIARTLPAQMAIGIRSKPVKALCPMNITAAAISPTVTGLIPLNAPAMTSLSLNRVRKKHNTVMSTNDGSATPNVATSAPGTPAAV